MTDIPTSQPTRRAVVIAAAGAGALGAAPFLLVRRAEAERHSSAAGETHELAWFGRKRVSYEESPGLL